MRLMIVRHGDPDYSIDSLTPKGWKEAELLADRLCKLDVKAFYVSPLGRAKDTASFTLKRLEREAEEMKWMREFDAQISGRMQWAERLSGTGCRLTGRRYRHFMISKAGAVIRYCVVEKRSTEMYGRNMTGSPENLISCWQSMAMNGMERFTVPLMPITIPLFCFAILAWNVFCSVICWGSPRWYCGTASVRRLPP